MLLLNPCTSQPQKSPVTMLSMKALPPYSGWFPFQALHCFHSQPGEPRSWSLILNDPLNQVEFSWAGPVSALRGVSMEQLCTVSKLQGSLQSPQPLQSSLGQTFTEEHRMGDRKRWLYPICQYISVCVLAKVKTSWRQEPGSAKSFFVFFLSQAWPWRIATVFARHIWH